MPDNISWNKVKKGLQKLGFKPYENAEPHTEVMLVQWGNSYHVPFYIEVEVTAHFGGNSVQDIEVTFGIPDAKERGSYGDVGKIYSRETKDSFYILLKEVMEMKKKFESEIDDKLYAAVTRKIESMFKKQGFRGSRSRPNIV